MPVQARKIDRDPVAEAARAAYDSAKGDLKTAVASFEASVRGNRALRDALLEPLLADACYQAVARIIRTERQLVWKPPVEKLVPSKVTNAHRVVQLAAGTLLMFPLPGGKKLGEATREEITAGADFYAAQSEDMAVKAKWLRLVAQSVPGEKKAGDVLSEKRLRELQEAARALAE